MLGHSCQPQGLCLNFGVGGMSGHLMLLKYPRGQAIKCMVLLHTLLQPNLQKPSVAMHTEASDHILVEVIWGAQFPASRRG